MGSGDFGGDHSVEWNIDAHNVKGTPSSTPGVGGPGKPKPHKQSGVDETVASGRFTVQIRVPALLSDPLYTELPCAAGSAVSGVLTFTLPIEAPPPGTPTPKQIVVSWPSDPNPSSVHGMAPVTLSEVRPKAAGRRPAKRGSKKRTSRRR